MEDENRRANKIQSRSGPTLHGPIIRTGNTTYDRHVLASQIIRASGFQGLYRGNSNLNS